jgi:hypothetical protein
MLLAQASKALRIRIMISTVVRLLYVADASESASSGGRCRTNGMDGR